MSREQMSRPSSSLPHQCAAEGDIRREGKVICAGSEGASQGAKIAQTKKSATSTTPIAASGLWRATRGSEMAALDISSESSYPAAITNCELGVNLRPQRSRRTAAEVAEKAFNREVRKEKRIASGLPSSMWVFTAVSSDSTPSTPGPSGN